MHIIQIIIDGFKSYPNVTEIKGFDSQFNAITGANGSGKSNVLDAICFVFGIQSLRQVRATTLKELIYKQGTAKVKEAKVTIVFDNTNKALSPPNYNQYDKIEVTREISNMEKSKYKINGKNQPAEKVKSLFLSVHLNVNNPHFLVLQGKITQVVNMKPKQILSLIEETSGTALFEKRKEEWLKMLNRKELTLREINETIENEIEPMRAKITESRENTRKYEDNEKKIDEIDRNIIKIEYWNMFQAVWKLTELNDDESKDFQAIAEEIAEYKDQLDSHNSKLKKITSNTQKEDEEIRISNEKLKNHEKEVNKLDEILRNQKISVAKNQEIMKEIEQKLDIEKHLTEKYNNNRYALNEKLSIYEAEVVNRSHEQAQIKEKPKEVEGKDYPTQNILNK